MRVRGGRAMGKSLLLSVLWGVAAPGAETDTEWHSYARDAGATRYSPLDQIDTDNVADLQRAWTFRTGDIAPVRAHYAECTPLMVRGVLYLITPLSRLIALDATSGKELWRFSPDPPIGLDEPNNPAFISRGVTWWEEDGTTRIFVPVRDGRLYSIDPATHAPDPAFGENGCIDFRAGLPEDGWFLFLSSPPAVCGDVLLQPYGMRDLPVSKYAYVPLRAFDVRTGAVRWTFDTVPRPGQFGSETWGGDSWKDRAGCNPWAPISVDQERGIFYVALGAPHPDRWGGERPGDNLFGNCLVALDAVTGERLWHFQTVHHDLWDYDLPAQPNLFECRQGDQRVPAVAVVGKTGFVYLFNRVTGAPIFRIEERPVPASDYPGEQASPTQPFPTKPPAFSRQSLEVKDLPALPDHLWIKVVRKLERLRNEGLFTPPSVRGSMYFPGPFGGGNWSGASVTPEGMMFVSSHDMPYISFLEKSSGPYDVIGKGIRFRYQQLLYFISMPWGRISKIDLNKGELVWERPLGNMDLFRDPGGEPSGSINFGGATTTAGGLVFVAATRDERFRALSAGTGETLFETKLEAAGYAAPVTYLGADGRQYVVIFAGGGSGPRTRTGDYVVAFALPGPHTPSSRLEAGGGT